MSKIILKATNICKNYFSPAKVTVLSGINLELHKGEAIAIQGASGEGKTTLLHILGALERPCSGNITVNEKLISFKDYSKTRNSLFGFIFQTYNLLEDLTVLDNVIMPAVIARNKPSKIYDRGKLLLQ
jgi:lipoprotein-releasing system ATP-binding protein